jgi:hypothetical protein
MQQNYYCIICGLFYYSHKHPFDHYSIRYSYIAPFATFTLLYFPFLFLHSNISVDKNQWHVFSLYENPLDASIRHMFIAKAGDWTTKVHRKINSCNNTSRPVWLSGPQVVFYLNLFWCLKSAISFPHSILFFMKLSLSIQQCSQF